ncbi:PIN domain-containing protein [Sphingomonas koreensis]|nr:PIN domain-containing protein [Sphingomonas koreensis]
MLVLDASLAGALVLSDEPDPPAVVTSSIAEGPLTAPAHWPLESANMLQTALRRGRIDRDGREDALRQLDELQVTIETGTAETLHHAIRLADRCALTVYDAAYLELAERTGATLASRDRALIAAAKAIGTAVLTY